MSITKNIARIKEQEAKRVAAEEEAKIAEREAKIAAAEAKPKAKPKLAPKRTFMDKVKMSKKK